ncbi:MAG: CHAT domain-containing protein, partial [Pseudomonadota bacterium]
MNEDRAALEAQIAQLELYEQRNDVDAVLRTRTQLGRDLFTHIDGPDRVLARLAAQARKSDDAWSLTVRLVDINDGLDAQHPAARWLWTSLHDGQRYLALEDQIQVAVQLGPIEKRVPRPLARAGVRVLFMAYSPEGVQPVLDYEQEEEQVLAALEAPLKANRATVHVVEEGSVSALEQRLRAAEYDVVHLSGHGLMTKNGPCLVMENDLGARDDVSPEVLLRAFKQGRKMPALVMISSCHSAEQTGEIPSLASALVAGGVPSVIGWVRPIRDDIASSAAAELYRRLCDGLPPAIAVRHARQVLFDQGEAGRRAWATLHLITRDAQGFSLDEHAPPLESVAPGAEATYRYLGESGRMKVLEKGFVGRRREMQQSLRVLRSGRDAGERPVAGVLLYGLKGIGKSCLAARVLDRHQQDTGDVGVVVIHGRLDDATVLESFTTLIDRWGDVVARAELSNGEVPVIDRVQRLLAGVWRQRSVVIVLDDFEQNVDPRLQGPARLQSYAASLVAVLLRQCRIDRPKLLITSTATFDTLPNESKSLVEIPVGALAVAATQKLWIRGKDNELQYFTPQSWQSLANRLGRNARVLDWARTLLRGESPEDLQSVLQASEAQLQWAPGKIPNAESQQRLAELFLRTLAYKRAKSQLSPDVLTFVERARVFEVAVPLDALKPLTEGLAIDLDQHLVALQNLGLLEVGQFKGHRAHRVSPLVVPEFDVSSPEQWHAVAAAFWWAQFEGSGLSFEQLEMGWRHALSAKDEAQVALFARRLHLTLFGRGLYRQSLDLAQEQMEALPESISGLLWNGFSLAEIGEPREGWRLFEKGEHACRTQKRDDDASWLLEGASILQQLGRYPEAATRLKRSLEIQSVVHGTDVHLEVAASLHALAGVLQAQGDLSGARTHLERALE